MVFDQTSENPSLLIGDVFPLILSIRIKQKNLIRAHKIIDDPDSTTLTTSGKPPSDLAKTSCPLDKITSFGIDNENLLKLSIRIIVEK